MTALSPKLLALPSGLLLSKLVVKFERIEFRKINYES